MILSATESLLLRSPVRPARNLGPGIRVQGGRRGSDKFGDEFLESRIS